ncbi:MAG: hypothetical protein ACXABY_25095 [Candidatus Thorarchaeota archaeon]|jgi:hypothetical protein
MFGKGVLKIIGLAMAGAMALAGGAQLLSSVAVVVIAFRSGDIIPLVLAVGTALALIQMRRLLSNHALSTIVGILAYAASGYIAVVAFVGLLPFGLVSSFIGAALTIVVCSLMHDPTLMNEWIAALSADSSVSWMGRSRGTSELKLSLDVSHQMILLPPESREQVITLMKDRPLLPISLTHYTDCDVLFIDTNSKKTSSSQVRDILSRMNILSGRDASPLLREAILKVPLIDARHGLEMTDYCLAFEEDTVIHLLKNVPSRMIVFPCKTGLRIIYPESAAPGLISEKVPENELVNTLLLHSYAGLEEVKDSHANTP